MSKFYIFIYLSKCVGVKKAETYNSKCRFALCKQTMWNGFRKNSQFKCETSLRILKYMSGRNEFRHPYRKVVNPCWTSFSTRSEVQSKSV